MPQSREQVEKGQTPGVIIKRLKEAKIIYLSDVKQSSFHKPRVLFTTIDSVLDPHRLFV